MYELTNEDIIIRFEKYLIKKDMRIDTIRNYIYDIKAYNTFLNGIHFYDATEQDVKRYIQNKIDKKNSNSRISFSMSVLTSFYKYLNRLSLTKNNPIKNLPKPKIKRKEKEYLNIKEVYNIRKKLKEHGDIQLEVFFCIVIASNPKKNIIHNIQWRKINWKSKYIEVDINDKERCILYLDDYTIDRLKALRKERKNKNIKQKWVFITRYNGHWNSISDAGINYWINKIKDINSLDKLNFNILKQSSLNYWKNSRKFSDEKINRILEHGKGWDIEFRQKIIDEIDEITKMK